jgi:arylsulfatase A-like enzyme
VCFLRFPGGANRGTPVNDFVYNIDFAPTILSFLGIEPHPEMEGIDLLPAIEGKATEKRRHVSVGWRGDIMVRTERFWYAGRLDRSEELLFDLQTDPEFRNNIAQDRRDKCGEMNEQALRDAGGKIPEYVMNFPKYEVLGGLPWER